MKKKILILLCLLFSFGYMQSHAGQAIDFNPGNQASSQFTSVSQNHSSANFKYQVSRMTGKGLKIFKIIVGGLLVIYLVYAGGMMAFSLGSNDQMLSDSKRSVWYAMVGLLFINIPQVLLEGFWGDKQFDSSGGRGGFDKDHMMSNLFVNTEHFGKLLGTIVTSLEVLTLGIAVIVLIISGLKIMTASGDEEKVSEAKDKIIWSIAGIIFIAIMEAWRNIVFTANFKGAGTTFFAQLANLAIFFSGPIAIFFLSLAGYYYITSGGDEEKVKKSKNILINTLLGVIVLVGMYTLLKDIDSLKIITE